MKKLTSLISALLFLAVCLTACKSSSDVPNSNPPANSNGPSPAAPSLSDDPFADSPRVKFTFADNNASSSSVGQSLAGLCETIYEATNGTVTVEYFGDAALGDEVTVVGMLEQGTIDLSRVNLASVQATIPELGVLTMPYIYKDGDHCVRVLESDVGQELLAKCGEHGMVGLAFMSSPAARGFYSTEPIRSVDSMKGKLVRVQDSDVAIRMVQALGAAATPMAYAEVYQALQTKVIDIAENDPNSYYLSGHYEIAKYFTYDNHQISPGLFIMSEKAWNSMSALQQETVRSCIQDFVTNFRTDLAAQLETNKALCEEAGCEFIEVDTTEWREACQSMYDSYPEYAEYLERIFAVQ